MTRKPIWNAEAVKAYESGQGVKLVSAPHPHYEPLPEDLNPESLETVEIDLPEPEKVILRKKPHLDKGRDYEEGFIDGMQHQAQSSVDKAVNAMSRTWVGLTDEEIDKGLLRSDYAFKTAEAWRAGVVFAMTKLKQKNGYDR